MDLPYRPARTPVHGPPAALPRLATRRDLRRTATCLASGPPSADTGAHGGTDFRGAGSAARLVASIPNDHAPRRASRCPRAHSGLYLVGQHIRRREERRRAHAGDGLPRLAVRDRGAGDVRAAARCGASLVAGRAPAGHRARAGACRRLRRADLRPGAHAGDGVRLHHRAVRRLHAAVLGPAAAPPGQRGWRGSRSASRPAASRCCRCAGCRSAAARRSPCCARLRSRCTSSGSASGRRRSDAYGLAVVQLTTVAVVSIVISAPDTLAPPPDAGVWGAILLTALGATAFGFLGQTWAQAHLASDPRGGRHDDGAGLRRCLRRRDRRRRPDRRALSSAPCSSCPRCTSSSSARATAPTPQSNASKSEAIAADDA